MLVVETLGSRHHRLGTALGACMCFRGRPVACTVDLGVHAALGDQGLVRAWGRYYACSHLFLHAGSRWMGMHVGVWRVLCLAALIAIWQRYGIVAAVTGQPTAAGGTRAV